MKCEDSLFKCFSTIVEGNELIVTSTLAEDIICNNLNITQVNDELKPILEEVLPFYMLKWPGWRKTEDYSNGEITFLKWYDKFKHYLIYKISHVIRNEKKFWMKGDDGPACNVVVAETQTKINGVKEDAPYNVTIAGMPSIIQNLVYYKVHNNIEALLHEAKEWQPLELNELLNWPCVSVHLLLPDIELTRQNIHECYRYFTLHHDELTVPNADYVDKIEETNDKHHVYSYDILAQYREEFKSLSNILNGNQKYAVRTNEILCILTEFLKDVESVNLCDKTIATNVKVSYKIGNSTYMRVRRMTSVEKGEVSFRELIIPRTQFILHRFNEEQTPGRMGKFKNLNSYREIYTRNEDKFADIFSIITSNCITYRCLFCTVKFEKETPTADILNHLEQKHQNEQMLKCSKCDDQFDIKDLAGRRWAHDCSETRSGEVSKETQFSSTK